MLKETVTISGISSNQLYGGSFSLQSLISAIELPTYCPMYDVSETLKCAFEEVTNKTNQKKIDKLVDEIKAGLQNTIIAAPLSLVVAIRGKVDFCSKKTSDHSTMTFSLKNAFVVDSPLLLSAIYQLLGVDNPYIGGTKLKEQSQSESELRQQLSTTIVSVTFLFEPEFGFSDNDIKDIFHYFSQRDVNFHSVPLNLSSEMPDLSAFVKSLAKDLSLDQLGGMSMARSRVTKSESYITTEATMISLVLSAIGGPKMRIGRHIPKTLPDNTPITLPLLQHRKPEIQSFLKGWLKPVEKQLRNDKDGFHYSTQFWQALGLVIYTISQNHESDESYFFQSGFKLGEIDYRRDAEHWSNCEAMQLDATGRYYKNATNGGRTFREGVAKYLTSLL